ncbi:MAG TPA: LPS assembly protein LptD [Acidobacteriota bacterium]|nr:LPS assembly protein LptD [Acidobacteriota bacterium]
MRGKLVLLSLITCTLLARALMAHDGLSAPELQVKAPPPEERVRTEIPYQDGTVILQSDSQERITRTRYRARGHVEITYQDIVLTCDEAEYDEETREGLTRGLTRFSQGRQWLTCSHADFNFSNQTGVFYDAQGFTDREFLIDGRTILKTGRDTYRIQEGFITSCQGKHPKWAFTLSKANIHVDRTARLHSFRFKIKGVPVLYFPYLVLPMERKERSSGFLPFHTGTSTSKGRVFNEGYFQTLGPSADMTLYGEYFSLRGLAWGGVFRARPNKDTHLFVQAYGIHDKLGQGGAQLVVDGESLLKDDWRAVARVNITSNFQFRQAFADTFRSATIPQERAVAFLTRNHESFSTNVAFEREEVLFPIRSLVTRKVPSLEFLSLGTPLGKTPFIFYLRTSLDGLSRVDSEIQTPRLVQRLDFYPRIALRLPSLAGFSLIPSAGLRETYYGARLSDTSPPEIQTRGLRRQYTDFGVELRTPTLEKSYASSWLGDFKHVIEPIVNYTRIHGVKDLHETVRFDEEDAIADTNELEYGIINRIFRTRKNASGTNEDYEFLSFSIMQKYFFDPTFGGAFQSGESNQFYPLDTLTGFSLTGTERNLAPASTVLRLSPKAGISHDVRADFDTKLQHLRDASVSTFWQQRKLLVAGTYFKTYALEPGTFASDQIQGLVGYGSPARGFSTSITISYNIQTRQLLNSNSRLNYMWDCCGLAVEFQQYALGLRTETRFSFSFTLKGIGSFGNLKRPESLF